MNCPNVKGPGAAATAHRAKDVMPQKQTHLDTPTTEYRQSKFAIPMRLIKLNELIERGLGSRSTIYERMAAGTFPKPVKLGRLNGWVEAEINAYIEQLIVEREAA